MLDDGWWVIGDIERLVRLATKALARDVSGMMLLLTARAGADQNIARATTP